MDLDSESLHQLSQIERLKSPTNASDFFHNFKEIFKQAFINNCHLDDASVTTDELEALSELDHLEILENLKDLLQSLLNFKVNIKSSTTDELATRCDQLEKLLQQQESEVRSHIRNEHQLKLYIDTMQQKLIDLERKYQDSQSIIKELEGKGCETMQSKLQKLEQSFHNELTQIVAKSKAENANSHLARIEKLEEMNEKKEKSYVKLHQDFQATKLLLEETAKECRRLKKEIEKHRNPMLSSEALTHRKEETTDKNLKKVQVVSKNKLLQRSKKVNHVKRNSEDSNFCSKFIEPTPPPETRYNSQVRSSLYNSRRHIRSQSDHSYSLSSKKVFNKH